MLQYTQVFFMQNSGLYTFIVCLFLPTVSWPFNRRLCAPIFYYKRGLGSLKVSLKSFLQFLSSLSYILAVSLPLSR